VQLAPEPLGGELLLQQPHAAQVEIRPEDVPHGLGLGRVDHQLALADVVTER
jgi:hypothetical protein